MIIKYIIKKINIRLQLPEMDSNIRNLIIGVLIGLVIVLIIYSFGDDEKKSGNNSLPGKLQNSIELKTNNPSSANTHLQQNELFTNPDDTKIQSLINIVSVGRDDKVSWVNSLSGQTQIITNPRTDMRADIKYLDDYFVQNVEIIPGIVGNQFQRIIDSPLPILLYNQPFATTTTSAGTTTTQPTLGTTILPKSVEYSKILLKLVNKAKSGVANPYYFNPRTGFKFYIIFNNNAGMESGATINCDAIFTSNSDGQEIRFDTCNIVYSTTKPKVIQLSFIKQTLPDNQTLPASEYGDIANNLVVKQTFDLQLTAKSTPNFDNITFLNLINQNVIPAISKLTYTIKVVNTKTNELQDILSYEINLSALLARRENMQEYTYKKLGNITEEVLNEKVGNIVAPMFLLDSKLNNMENNLKKVQDAYFFNNLSNNQTNYKFYNTT